jgi:thioesterase domain-containing protein
VPNPADPVGRVYLFRGQGWVFSGGWRTLCERLRAAGAQAEDLSDHGGDWAVGQILADRKAGRLRGPLVFVGHSRGGRVCLRAAEELASAGVPVDLILTVDVMGPPDVPANVRRAVNLYLTAARVYPAAPLKPAAGSPAAIENIDLNAAGSPVSGDGLDHLSVTGSPQLLEYLFRRIARVMRGRPRESGGS